MVSWFWFVLVINGIDINDVPLLLWDIFGVSSSNLGTFRVLTICDINNFSFLIDKLSILVISEKLVPVRISVMSVELVSTSHIKRCIGSFVFDGSGLVVENKHLSLLSVLSLNDRSVTNQVHVSSTVHCGENVEWSVDIHTPEFGETFSWFWFSFSDIKNGPLLVLLVISVLSDDLSVLMVESTLNRKYLSFLIDEHMSILVKLPFLVPLGISVVSICITTSDINGSVWVFN